MNAITSNRYSDEQQRLRNDLIIVRMAADLKAGIDAGSAPRDRFQHDTGDPTFEFMTMASREYARQGGTQHETIGGPAVAILSLLSTTQKES